MKIYEDKLKKRSGYEEGKAEAIDKATVTKALSYKNEFLKKFIAINPLQIDSRLGDSIYWVTRKYDGEFADIIYDSGQAVIVNRSGRVRRGIPCIDQAAAVLQKNGVKQAIIPAEIYVYNEKKKTRVNDLINALANEKKIGTLRLACYDILELDGKDYKPKDYGQTLEELGEILRGGELCHEVDWLTARSNGEVKEIFSRWVEQEGSEGLVVRSEMPFVWKIKPRHNVDAVVVGFTEGTGNARGQVRTLLLALMPEAGKYQIVTRVGGGMTVQQKQELFEYFSPRVMSSEFVDTDSNHVAFQMVEPDRVIEFSVNDVRWESPNGLIQNTLLEISEGVYRVADTVNGISFVAPVIERFRDDKRADAEDVRLLQVEDFSSFEPEDVVRLPVPKMQPSEMLFREVYRKKLGEKIMVLKFTGWKTNKEKTGEWPAYVLHTTNFSSDRLQRLQRDVEITDHYEQLISLREKAVAENVKKGWVKVE
ncbi:MAG: hypothetical protein LUD68_09800 [Rikenellaceae bacterium]|nr:hypothetical protein [Rikenellaceae bacterium]